MIIKKSNMEIIGRMKEIRFVLLLILGLLAGCTNVSSDAKARVVELENVIEFTLLGAVNDSGIKTYYPKKIGKPLMITDVLNFTGGLKRSAYLDSVHVKRKFSDGKEQIYTIRMWKILKDPASENFPILNGDVVEIPDSVI